MTVSVVESDLFRGKGMRVSGASLAIESIVVRLIGGNLTSPWLFLLPCLLHLLSLLSLFLQMVTSHMILYIKCY